MSSSHVPASQPCNQPQLEGFQPLNGDLGEANNLEKEIQHEESSDGVPKPSINSAPEPPPLPSAQPRGGKLMAGSVDVSALYPSLETEKCAKIIS